MKEKFFRKECYIRLLQLAIQLESYDYKVKFSDKELRTDWQNLCKFKDDVKQISSTVRHGMKISEHFMENFYDIKDPKDIIWCS